MINFSVQMKGVEYYINFQSYMYLHIFKVNKNN